MVEWKAGKSKIRTWSALLTRAASEQSSLWLARMPDSCLSSLFQRCSKGLTLQWTQGGFVCGVNVERLLVDRGPTHKLMITTQLLTATLV